MALQITPEIFGKWPTLHGIVSEVLFKFSAVIIIIIIIAQDTSVNTYEPIWYTR